jgi:hypothetical protein
VTTTPPPGTLVTLVEAAALVHRSTNTLEKWVCKRWLPVARRELRGRCGQWTRLFRVNVLLKVDRVATAAKTQGRKAA